MEKQAANHIMERKGFNPIELVNIDRKFEGADTKQAKERMEAGGKLPPGGKSRDLLVVGQFEI